MQITRHSHPHQIPQPNILGPRTDAASANASAEVGGVAGGQRADSGNLVTWLKEVREDAAVRPLQVEQAKAKLQQGAYFTRAAADEAANALLSEFS